MSKLTEEVRARLTYIVESPSAENGGFHPETVEAAKQALALVQQVEAAEKLALSLNEVMAMRQAVIDVGGAEGPLDLQVIAKFAEMQVGVTDRIVAALAHWEEVTKQ